MQIGAKKAVTFHYSLRDDEGKVLDSSEGKTPLTYLHGEGNIVPGLEKALEGKQAGDEVKATVPPAEGYGVRDEENIFNVPRRKLPEGKIEPGMTAAAAAPNRGPSWRRSRRSRATTSPSMPTIRWRA